MGRVAVVGAGISGVAAAYELDQQGHDVTLIEACAQLGGHTHTRLVPGAGRGGADLAVDMGFIVHNTRTYARFVALLDELGVAVRDTEMSFSVDCAGCGLQYSGRSPWAQLPGILRPRMLRLVAEIRRFHRDARAILARLDEGEDGGTPEAVPATLAAFVAERGYSENFARHYLVPLTAAIWSTAPRGVLDFPMEYALRFFDNHGLLQWRGLRWRTIVGGSVAYLDAVQARWRCRVLTDTPVTLVAPAPHGVQVQAAGLDEQFDAVIVATHPDQALELLDESFEQERAALAHFEYTTSDVVLHTDTRLLPRRQRVRASWNYQLPTCSLDDERPTMTYYMNRLQGLDTDHHFSVTLNRGAAIDEHRIVARCSFAHPRYTSRTLAGQAAIGACQGSSSVYFAGAWLGDGFHEAGCTSGMRAAEQVQHGLRASELVE